MDIENKVAVVTGGTGGIGFSTVRALLRNSARHVAIFDVDVAKSTGCLQELNEEFGAGRASFHPCDVANSGQFADLFDRVVGTQKRVDILINCSGVARENQPDLTISVNLIGVINSCITAIDRMGKHNGGQGGTIVNVASILGLIDAPVLPVYGASKHGVINFTTSLKEHFDHTGVRALTICPGATDTPMRNATGPGNKSTLDFVKEDLFDKFLSAYTYSQPPENVAEAIVKMIERAEPGSVWVSEMNKQPYAIRDLPFYTERAVPI